MTRDQLLSIVRAGHLNLLARYEPERGAFISLHGATHIAFYQDKWDEIQAAAAEHLGELFMLVRLNDAAVCISVAHQHTTAIHPISGESYQKCEACERTRMDLAIAARAVDARTAQA